MYLNRCNYLVKLPKALRLNYVALGKTPAWFVWVLAVSLLISAGITYRVLASHFKLITDTPIRLPVPLSAFPAQIGNWAGRDLPIATTTKEYMEEHFADDFLSRRYINSATKAWADVYIVYCSSRPGGILGHRPQVCYPGYGWINDSTEPSQFISRAGQQIHCLIHRFHKPASTNEQIVVLNFYILNGQITTDENDFSGPLSRRPNIAGDPARYVAQVQISSVLENSIRAAALDMTKLITDFLPDENGRVRAVEYNNVIRNALK
ncbi:MAG: hypothetical protein AMJ43_07460 [Coxiella sp. DG_40]|nr:MAG: hypothetical protein AMJ43_07460 [Coxiella sp. DG_40]